MYHVSDVQLLMTLTSDCALKIVFMGDFFVVVVVFIFFAVLYVLVVCWISS